MKALFTLALIAVTTIASAQPGHHRGHHKHKKHHTKHYTHKHHRDDDRYYRHNQRRVVRYDRQRDAHYYVNREMSRYDFLRLSRAQRAKLQVSLNYMIVNNYGPTAYERRLRADLRNILTRNQYRMWQRNAYRGGGNTFVFNFNR